MNKTIKASELKQHINNLPDDADVSFGPSIGEALGSLTLFRIKKRGPNLFNIEFNEIFEVTSDPSQSE
jgi:hypothetical protein